MRPASESPARAARRLQELEALYRADAILHRSLQLDDVLQALVEVATGILNADKASVLVWDAAHERLVARAAHGYSSDSVTRLAFAPHEGIAGIVVRTRETVMVEDLHGDARASPRITRLTDAGIQLHCQVVLCPGLNDGNHLERTIQDLLKFHPDVASLAIVPVGLTDHRKNLPELTPFTHDW